MRFDGAFSLVWYDTILSLALPEALKAPSTGRLGRSTNVIRYPSALVLAYDTPDARLPVARDVLWVINYQTFGTFELGIPRILHHRNYSFGAKW